MVKNNSVEQALSWSRIEPELDMCTKKYLSHHEIVEQVDSTNRLALEVCGNKAWLPAVFLAEQQFAGKGRNGRLWVSPYGKNIYLSMVSMFQLPVTQLTGLSIAIGVELARLLRRYGVDVALKWPNDVLVDMRKLAGILVETRVKAENQVCVVMGVGLNYGMDNRDADEIDQHWTDFLRVMNTQALPARNLLAAELINGLVNVCIKFPVLGLDGWLDDWKVFDVCDARNLEIIDGENKYSAIGAGISDTGGLKVNIDGKLKTLNSSEISIRVMS